MNFEAQINKSRSICIKLFRRRINHYRKVLDLAFYDTIADKDLFEYIKNWLITEEIKNDIFNTNPAKGHWTDWPIFHKLLFYIEDQLCRN